MKRHWLTCFLLCALTLLVYAQTLTFGFVVLDDPVWVAGNPFVYTGLSGRNVSWAFSRNTMNLCQNWVPFTFLSFMLDAQLYGGAAGGFHLTNVLLHCANALLLYAALYQMTRHAVNCAIVAALFAIHPLHVESVAWVTGRKDVLSLFFGLLAIWSYACYADGRKTKYYLASIVLYLCSLLAKQTLVTLPFLLLLLDFWPLERWTCNRHAVHSKSRGKHNTLAPCSSDDHGFHWLRLLREKIPFFVLSLLFCLLALVAQTKALSDQHSLPVRIARAPIAYVDYLAKAFSPSNMSVFYPHSERTVSVMNVGAAVLLLLTISALAVVLAKRAPYLFTGWFWFLGTFVPMIGIVQVGGQRIADRYTYVPLTGLFLLAIWLLDALVRGRLGRRYLLPAATAVSITALALVSWRQTSYWQDSVVLFEHGLSVTANNGFLHEILGVTLFEQGEEEESFAHFRKAARIEPNYRLYAKWGNCLNKAGRTDEAIQATSRALTISPDYAPAHYALGLIREDQGRLDLARGHYETALASDPLYAEAHYNLGTLLANEGRLAEAVDHFQQALTVNPMYAQAHNNLAAIFFAQHRLELARLHFEEALRIDPSLEQARRAVQALNGQRLKEGTP